MAWASCPCFVDITRARCPCHVVLCPHIQAVTNSTMDCRMERAGAPAIRIAWTSRYNRCMGQAKFPPLTLLPKEQRRRVIWDYFRCFFTSRGFWIWVVFFCGLIGISVLYGAHHMMGIRPISLGAISGGVVAVTVLPLFRIAAECYRRTLLDHQLCPACAHDLNGHVGGPCPKCGRTIDDKR